MRVAGVEQWPAAQRLVQNDTEGIQIAGELERRLLSHLLGSEVVPAFGLILPPGRERAQVHAPFRFLDEGVRRKVAVCAVRCMPKGQGAGAGCGVGQPITQRVRFRRFRSGLLQADE